MRIGADIAALESVGVVYRAPVRFDEAWSGTPAGIARGFHELGLRTLALNAELPAPLQPLMRAWGAIVHGGAGRGKYAPELRPLAAAAGRWRRRSLPEPDFWVYCARAVSDAPPPRTSPFVTFADMTIVQAARENEAVRSLPRRLVASMERRQRQSYGRATACCVTSDWAAESVVSDYGIPAARVAVVGLGRNCEPRPVPRDWNAPRFLFVGKDWKRKNGDRVVRAFSALRREIDRARLDLVGGHPRVDTEGVVAHGPLRTTDASERRRLESLYEQATCFVMPSHFEAFGVVYIEAAAAGVGSIGTTRGGAATAVGTGGMLVHPESDGELLDAMRLFARPADARQFGSVALERSSSYTWAAVADRVRAAVAAHARSFRRSAPADVASSGASRT